jgi:mono/diheme cytochrome c family protein
MRLVGKIILWVVGAGILAFAALILYVKMAYPKVGLAPSITVSATAERIERGKYLANHVAVCMDCHSQRDWTRYSGPPKDGTLGMGGDKYGKELGFPGDFWARNITPHNLGNWSDGEIIRAFTEGVDRNGNPYFPLMPYPTFKYMATEDVNSIVAYLRSIPAINSDVPPAQPSFPFSLIMRLIPSPAEPMTLPDKSDTVAYGKYLTTIAACGECHTPADKGKPIDSMRFAGGFEFHTPWGVVRSANLTPDPETGLGDWDREAFVQVFKGYATDEARQINVPKGEFNTVMPWTMYGGMTEEDLGAIYAYLHSLKPIKHTVERFTPAEATAGID